MATSIPAIPFPFSAQIPVTPPPDHQAFPPAQPPLSPHAIKTFAKDVFYGAASGKLQPQLQPQQQQQQQQPQMNKVASPSGEGVGMLGAGAGMAAGVGAGAGAGAEVAAQAEGAHPPPLSPFPTQTPATAAEAAAMAQDPRYLAMASRIAAYYQQRCQAMANYQQQRCQAWANLHRQKCQEMMQAAMLVVAWYIRDRIQRRRRRRKRQFRHGLSERATRNRVAKGETVRKWVLQVPEDALSPSNPIREALADHDEADFDMDKEMTPDKDVKLYDVADNLIKSQLARIDVPLMGALSFDQSDDEDDSDSDEERSRGGDKGGDNNNNMQEDEEEEEEEEDMDDLDDDDEELEDYEEDEGSEVVQHGTGKGSRKRTRSSLS